MSATTIGTATPIIDQRDKLVERLFGAVLGFNEVCMVHIGEVLGLYRVLNELGAATAAGLAQATGTTERYVREWLECQAVSGILVVDDVGAPADQRRYSLPEGHVDVLTDADSPAYMAAFARMQVGIASPLAQVIEAFRSGGGVNYADYGADFCEGQGIMNRVGFVNDLASTWLPAIPDLHERLLAEPPARVIDIACGVGWSTIALARAYPDAEVSGVDLDTRSIELARENARGEGLGDRLAFEACDAASLDAAGSADLVTIFEAIHDMSQPVDVLRTARGLLAPDGTVLVADERVSEQFVAPGDDLEQLMYGWSVLHCLPVGMSSQPSVATGTVMRSSTMADYAGQAGFARTEMLDIEHDFWRFYRLHQ